MKPFDLEKALSGVPVIDSKGRKVTQLTLFKVNPDLKELVGIVDECYNYFYRDGIDKYTGESVLFMAPKVKTYWINVYRYTEDSGLILGEIFNSEKECIKRQDEDSDNSFFVKRISFEIEE